MESQPITRTLSAVLVSKMRNPLTHKEKYLQKPTCMGLFGRIKPTQKISRCEDALPIEARLLRSPQSAAQSNPALPGLGNVR